MEQGFPDDKIRNHKIMRIYLDNCCFNRPYDNQSYHTVRFETEAKLFIQDLIINEQIELVWSFILDFENSANPYEVRKESINEWASVSNVDINPTETIMDSAKEIEISFGIKPKDSLHIACAIDARSEYFLTTDKILFKKSGQLKEIKVINPLEFVRLWEEK